ncbi:MAG: hypothetical protein QM497_03215 [Sulfurimonas sp.]
MQKDIFDKIISFLLGASWAITLLGALIVFKTFLFLGLIFSFFITILYIFFILLLILTLDTFSVNRERLEESKKQTKLLEQIYNK